MLTVAPCEEKDERDTFYFSHFLEDRDHGERKVQELRPQRRRRSLLQLVRRRHAEIENAIRDLKYGVGL